MGKFIDLTGKKFGRLTVIKTVPHDGVHPWFLCICECGNTCEARSDKLRDGRTQSCGCLHRELNQTIGDKLKKTYVVDGKTYTKKDILKITGISPSTFYRKLREGKTIKEILYPGGIR